MSTRRISHGTPFIKTDIKIPSSTPRWNLDAWCYRPTQSSRPCGVIIM